MNDNEKDFNYTYSAEQQEEVKNILQKYTPGGESAIDALKRLDKNAERPGMIASITVGTAGTLILGSGMSCVMEFQGLFTVGIIAGIVGMAAVISAYPIFKVITKKQREKIAPQIIELSNKLIK